MIITTIFVSTVVAVMVGVARKPKKCEYTTCNKGVYENVKGKEIKPANAAKYCRAGFCSYHCLSLCKCLAPMLLFISLEDERRKRLLLETNKEIENLD